MANICTVLFNDYFSDARARRQAEALVERGHEVDCICLANKGGELATTIRGVRLHFHPFWKYQGKSRVWYFCYHLQFMISVFFTLSRLHLEKRYDVVVVSTLPDYLVFVAVLPKLMGAKIVIDVRELMPEMYSSKYGGATGWMVRLLTFIERASIAFAHKALAVHSVHLDALIKHGNPPEHFTVQLNVPDPKIFYKRCIQQRTSPKFRLIYHGTVAKRHGIDIALRALALARREITDIEFRVIGRGDYLSSCKQLTKQLGLDDCVEFLESVAVDDLPEFIGDADLGLVPYPKDAFTPYMLPVKLMEYTALGIPVTASRLDAITAYFDDTMVRYVEPGNEAELAAQIVHLYRNPTERSEIANSAVRFTAEHNWEKDRRVFYELIDSLVAPTHAS